MIVPLICPCIESPFGFKRKDGYYEFSNPVGGQYLVHRWIYIKYHHVTLRPEQVVRHLCNNPSCTEITHLALGTQQDNIRDRNMAGRTAKGEKHGSAVITERDVIYIRRMKGIVDQKFLAERFGISYQQIGQIQKGRYWKHVEENL